MYSKDWGNYQRLQTIATKYEKLLDNHQKGKFRHLIIATLFAIWRYSYSNMTMYIQPNFDGKFFWRRS